MAALRQGRERAVRSEGPVTAEQASFRLWLSFVLVLLAFGVGASWDRSWHTHNQFNDFFSPPHLFIYSTFGLGALVMLSLARSKERSAWYGPPLRLALPWGLLTTSGNEGGGRLTASGGRTADSRLSVEAPACLLLALAGFGVVMLGGFLDMVWHNAFGLDETNWSTPHSTIGWGVMLTWFGILSSRLALSRHIGISRPFIAISALLSLSVITQRFLGALGSFPTLKIARAVGSLQVLESNPDFQHTLRIVEKYDLTYSNALFPLLLALGAGAGLAFVLALVSARVEAASSSGRTGRRSLAERLLGALTGPLMAAGRRLTSGRMGFVVLALLATFFSYSSAHSKAIYFDKKFPALELLQDSRNFLPLPFVVAAVVYLLSKRSGAQERWAWVISGFVFGMFVVGFWDLAFGLAILSGPLMAAGAYAGARVWGWLREPDLGRVRALTAVAVVAPLVTGAADLFMRWTTP